MHKHFKELIVKFEECVLKQMTLNPPPKPCRGGQTILGAKMTRGKRVCCARTSARMEAIAAGRK